MAEPIKLLTPHEAAALAGINERDMHRAIDEGIVPDYLVQVSGKRRGFTPAACVLMGYYVGLAEKLTGKERKRVVREAAPRIHDAFLENGNPSADSDTRFTASETNEPEDLSAQLRPFLARVRERLPRLQAARNLVTRAPDILNGTPVVRGTRIPVYTVAGTYAEEGPAGARDAYPDLDPETIELAKLYADTHPPRGRPRTHAVPEGARAVRTWNRKRRRGARRSGSRR